MQYVGLHRLSSSFKAWSRQVSMSAHPIPVIDVDVASRSTAPAHLIKAVKAATEEIGVIQAVNHGVPQTLLDEFNHRVGRLKLERFNVGQFDNVAHARASGLAVHAVAEVPSVEGLVSALTECLTPQRLR